MRSGFDTGSGCTRAGRRWAAAVGAATLFAAWSAVAAPKHDVCADIGPSLGLGISSYGSAEGWPEKAEANGVPWKFLYYYVFPSQDTAANVGAFIAAKAQVASGLHATMVITFYDLLKRGTSAGVTARAGAQDSEADVVQQVLADPTLMKGYFDGFVVVLKAAANAGVPTMVHVEPDSWGFMMWAMGVEGRKDPTTLPVAVVGSGQADLAGQSFSDDAAGFGKALLHLRDQYAPGVRLGWHASNFRAGSGGDVVAAFYSGMGDWDAIVTEDPHVLRDPTAWWLPLDANAVDANVAWFEAVSQAARLPILMWQVPIGPFDFHFFGEGGAGEAVLSRFEAAGLAGMMWEQQGTGDPDTFRGIGLATPPSSSAAGGTALDLRTRLAAFEQSAPAFPPGSPCAPAASSGGAANATGGASSGGAANGSGGANGGGANGGGGANAGGTGPTNGGSAGQAGSVANGGSIGGAGASSSDAGVLSSSSSASDTGGCGCRVVSHDGSWRAFGAFVLALLAILRRSSPR
jgi:MYXO-CTERM domain-containing protein